MTEAQATKCDEWKNKAIHQSQALDSRDALRCNSLSHRRQTLAARNRMANVDLPLVLTLDALLVAFAGRKVNFMFRALKRAGCGQLTLPCRICNWTDPALAVALGWMRTGANTRLEC